MGNDNNQNKRTIPHHFETAVTGAGTLVKYCRYCPQSYVLDTQTVEDAKTKEQYFETVWIAIETVGADGQPTKEIRNCVGDYGSTAGERGRDTREEATPVRRVVRVP